MSFSRISTLIPMVKSAQPQNMPGTGQSGLSHMMSEAGNGLKNLFGTNFGRTAQTPPPSWAAPTPPAASPAPPAIAPVGGAQPPAAGGVNPQAGVPKTPSPAAWHPSVPQPTGAGLADYKSMGGPPGGLPIQVDPSTGRPFNETAASPVGAGTASPTASAVGAPGQNELSTHDPKLQQLFRHYNGGSFDPNSAMDRFKMQNLMKAFNQGGKAMYSAEEVPYSSKMACFIPSVR